MQKKKEIEGMPMSLGSVGTRYETIAQYPSRYNASKFSDSFEEANDLVNLTKKHIEREGVEKAMLGLAREAQDYGQHVIDGALFMIIVERQLYNILKSNKFFKSAVELSDRKDEFLALQEM